MATDGAVVINTRSVEAVDALRKGSDFVGPCSDQFNFASIPPLVRGLFGDPEVPPDLLQALLGPLASTYNKVVLCLVDGFGWRFLDEFRGRYPFLDALVDQGCLTKLSAQFPSTTAAHISTVHTGLPVAEHGIYEWFYFEPALDRMIAPLPFAYADDDEPGTLIAAGVHPASILPSGEHYSQLASLGVRTRLFQSRAFTPSPYMYVTGPAAEAVPIDSPSDGAHRLAESLLADRSPAFLYLYAGEIDTATHRHGIGSPQFLSAADLVFSALGELHRLLDSARRTLLLVTADHGLVESTYERTVFLDVVAPELGDLMRRTHDGRRLAPAGAGRDLFLHVEPDHIDEAMRLLMSGLLDGVAEVRLVRDLIRQGYFRGTPSPEFLARVGDIVVMPRRLDMVWWNESGKFPVVPAHHGGLSPEEMEVPLLARAY